MNLRDLHYLVAVAEYRHFGKAAESCCVSQPTLSAQLKKLESYLGVQLVERTQRQVMLTAVGQDVVERAKGILRDAEQIQELAKQAQNPEETTIRFGITATLGSYFISQALPWIKMDFPKLVISLYEGANKDILQQLYDGRLDVVIGDCQDSSEKLIVENLFQEEIKLVIPDQHPLQYKHELKLDDLENETILMQTDEDDFLNYIKDFFSKEDIRVNFNQCGKHPETLKQMVKFGSGVAFLPSLLLNDERQLEVNVRQLSSPKLTRPIHMCWRKNSVKNQFLKKLYRHLKGLPLTRETACISQDIDS